MRPRIVWTIFRKEITETLRDRRSLLMMIGLPVLLYPLMMIGLTKVQESHSEAQEARASQVAVWGTPSAALLEWLKKTNILTLERWAGIPESLQREFEAGRIQPPPLIGFQTNAASPKTAAPSAHDSEADNPVLAATRSLVSSRAIDAVLVIWPGFDDAMAQGGLGKVSIYYDSVRENSRKAHDRLDDELMAFRKQQVAERERARGLAEGFSVAINVLSRNVAPPDRRLGQLIGSILPFLLIIMSASGGLYAAIDLTAGEKERNTMQTLLCAPLQYAEIIGGKFLAAWVVVLITALANIASLAATFTRIMVPLGPLSVAPSTYVLTFLMLLPVTFTITALFLAVAVFAKDFKDGQNFLTPVFMLLMLPLGATILPGIELNAWTAFVPVVNIALLIKAVFLGEARPDAAFLTLVSSAAYAMLTLLFAARVFYREQVLLGGKESVRTLFSFERQATPTPTLALTTFAMVFVLVFYGTLLLEGSGILTMLLVTQYGFFLAPTLALAAGLKFSARETFSLRRPHWRAVLGAVLMGLSAWAVAGGLIIRLLPPPESFVKAMQKMLLFGDKPIPLWAMWLAIGVTPAICEELFFRGLIFSGLRRWGKWPAILVSAFLFAIAHSSIYRLLPTLFLGILLGYVAWRTGSIFCTIIIHAVNNGLLATFLYSEALARKLNLQDVSFLPWSLTLGGAAVLAVSLLLFRSVPRPGERLPATQPAGL